jgi:hypothetical protein
MAGEQRGRLTARASRAPINSSRRASAYHAAATELPFAPEDFLKDAP